LSGVAGFSAAMVEQAIQGPAGRTWRETQ
jgi:hypothetical protein